MNRIENLGQLRNNSFDICIIGAGASGGGVALDAVLRGYSVAVIDKGDFSGETSSKSTKLIHGGVRYLEQAFKKMDLSFLKQVEHGLIERWFLLQNAPHLSRPLAIVTPVFSWFEGLYYSIGLKIYSWFAKNDNLPSADWLSKKEAFAFCPDLNPMVHSAVMYYDGQLNDAKFALALVQSADKLGAAVANYVAANDFIKDASGKITALKVTDEVAGSDFEIKAKYFINCTGPIADTVRIMANMALEKRMMPSKGVHFLISKKFFNSEKAMLIPKTKDGRLVFVIPFQSEVMVGTTDTAYNEIEKEPLLQKNEALFLLDTLKPFLKNVPDLSQIKAGFGGLRPLLAPKQSKDVNATKTLLRDHEIELDSKSGLISLMGGKWTTYRLMAEDTVNLVDKLSGKVDKGGETHTQKLVGAQQADFDLERIKNQYKNDFEPTQLQHLYENYGDQMSVVLDLAIKSPELKSKIHPDYVFIKAEVVYACQYEMATLPRDFLARRIRFELLDWKAAKDTVQTVADIMAVELNWDTERVKMEVKNYTNLLENFISQI